MKITTKYFLSFFLLLFFSCTYTSFSSEQKGRSFEQFMKENPSLPHVIIVGTGHKVKSYPQNYFLMDIKNEGVPDLKGDICATIPQEMHEKFDVVILEHLPMNCIPSGMKNIKDLLKTSGKLGACCK